VGGKEESASFLKKRSKKLLLVGLGRFHGLGLNGQSFFCFFFVHKKEVLFVEWRWFLGAALPSFWRRGDSSLLGRPGTEDSRFRGNDDGEVLGVYDRY
jgi:hypothetical protein